MREWRLASLAFDAPENVAFVVLGLLYGEGDFGKSLIIANNCGEDTDCIHVQLLAHFWVLFMVLPDFRRNGQNHLMTKL